ncbi:uncharacterized protein LOC130621500 [Hydractinia symbiolongicarpus]|uniref:uncharacterized protein LOC130621500 n=1 Tax=Hydractinia symbiolongicarpus TaxID=13093 RepID=UPI00254A3309|nr:uncharacterized protein LOC130621500 [Hydractinia symbiolongicarpus]
MKFQQWSVIFLLSSLVGVLCSNKQDTSYDVKVKYRAIILSEDDFRNLLDDVTTDDRVNQPLDIPDDEFKHHLTVRRQNHQQKSHSLKNFMFQDEENDPGMKAWRGKKELEEGGVKSGKNGNDARGPERRHPGLQAWRGKRNMMETV